MIPSPNVSSLRLVKAGRSGQLSLMRIEVNGESKELAENTTVRGLLENLGLGDTLVAVERNRQVVPRAAHASTALADGDEIEVVHFVGGG